MSKVAPPFHQTIGDHGYVRLTRTSGRDLDIVNAAKVSFNKHSEDMGEHELAVLDFLMKNGHGSPFEQVQLYFEICLPIFVMRQVARHRMASFNEESARYSELTDIWWLPTNEDVTSQVGKPGSYKFEEIEDADLVEHTQHALNIVANTAFDTYHDLLKRGVAKEIARTCLPVSTYTHIVWTCNMRALLNFLALRNDEHAQKQIREYAVEIERMATLAFPLTMTSFNMHGRRQP